MRANEVQDLRIMVNQLQWEVSMLRSELNTLKLLGMERKDSERSTVFRPFWGAIEMRDGVPLKWHPNDCLEMSAEEQYRQNIANGYAMPPRQ